MHPSPRLTAQMNEIILRMRTRYRRRDCGAQATTPIVGPAAVEAGQPREHVMASEDDYVRFDQYENTLVSLELVAHFASLVREKPQLWKWMIVGAHDALQDAMVCAYADSTGTSILTKKSGTRMLDWLNADPDTRVGYP